ncbi:MAG: PQQ-dependent sugar dehydrogenase [Candidatus Kerfeldbacteria bacterium]|nr:PQQ-dependent sugar dehydrogenase [Candidatus Kerfeldbacteria bacterium]
MKTRLFIILLLLLAAAWAVAYWFVGADAKFLWGLIKSGFEKPGKVQVVANVNSSPESSGRRFIGFQQTVVSSGFTKPTRMDFEPNTNDLFVSELGGKIWRLKSDGTKQEVASGFSQLLGISFEPTYVAPPNLAPNVGAPLLPRLIVASRSTVSYLTNREDGTYGDRQDILLGLPAGRHQTDLALIGPDRRLYVATGSRSDRGETGITSFEASILVADAEGEGLRVFAKGLRNPFGMTFHNGKLYVSDNGQDVPANGVPDELNIVEEGKDYGWVGCWGVNQGSDCTGTEPPVALLQEHSSANGFAVYDAEQFPEDYRGNFFIALWGANSRDPDIGKKVVRVIPQDSGLWKTEDFATGFGNPIDVKVDPTDGSLLVLDFGTGQVIQVSARYE